MCQCISILGLYGDLLPARCVSVSPSSVCTETYILLDVSVYLHPRSVRRLTMMVSPVFLFFHVYHFDNMSALTHTWFNHTYDSLSDCVGTPSSINSRTVDTREFIAAWKSTCQYLNSVPSVYMALIVWSSPKVADNTDRS